MALRSAIGVSDSYRNAATKAKSSEEANGDGPLVSTSTTRVFLALMSVKGLLQGGKIEVVSQHFPVGLEDDREGPVLAGYAEEVGGPSTLQPEGCAGTRPPTGEQQGATCRFAEPGCKQSRVGQLFLDELSRFLGVEGEVSETGGFVAVGESEGDAVVGPDDVDVAPESGTQLVGEGHCPRCVDPGAERGEEDDAPVSDLVAEPFDHEGLVCRENPCRFSFFAQIGHEVESRKIIEVVGGGEGGRGFFRLEGADLSHELTDSLAGRDRSSQGVALPERQLRRGLARSRYDLDPIGPDVGDAPGAGAEDEDVADPRFVDHLFVEFTDPAAVREADPEQAAVGDGPGVGDDKLAGARPRLDGAAHAVPGDAGPKLGEEIGRVAAGEHVEGGVKDRSGEFAIGMRSPGQVEQIIGGSGSVDDRGDKLLAENVERISGDRGQFDVAFQHLLANDSGGQEVAPILGEDSGPALTTDLVTRPPDSLQARGDRYRGLDLNDQVDSSHVDPKFK